MDKDPTFRAKSEYIAAHNLVVYRFFDNWNARQPDAQLQGLAKALGSEKNYKPSGGLPWTMPRASFSQQLHEDVKYQQAPKMKSIRVAGDPDITVHKAALLHGMYWLPDLQKALAEPGVDLVIAGEPQWENELCQYSFDLHAAGVRKGLILLGQQVSEEPGSGEMATWLKSFVKEVPVEWIPAGEPAWMPYLRGMALT